MNLLKGLPCKRCVPEKRVLPITAALLPSFISALEALNLSGYQI